MRGGPFPRYGACGDGCSFVPTQADTTIDVNLDISELEVSKAETKATIEGNRVPKCPEDKRKAILDAFRHFKMI